jgi:hypothetical protein
MAPLLILACILVFVLGNIWFLLGMPVVAPIFILFAACFLGGLYFLFGMPVIIAVLARAYCKSRKLTLNLLVAVVMLFAFYISATLTWFLITTEWNLSFLTTLKAAGDAKEYGHPIEHAAQGLLASLLTMSTLSAVAAGAVTAAVRHLCVRHRRLAA